MSENCRDNPEKITSNSGLYILRAVLPTRSIVTQYADETQLFSVVRAVTRYAVLV